MIGQIQVLDLADPAAAKEKLLSQKQALLDEAAKVDPVLMKLGGGPKDLVVRLIPESPIGAFLVLHLIYDVRDAMGANAVNTAVERLAPRVEAITGGRVLLRILSNLADRRLAKSFPSPCERKIWLLMIFRVNRSGMAFLKPGLLRLLTLTGRRPIIRAL